MENRPLRIKDRVEYLDGFAYIDEDVKSAKRLFEEMISSRIIESLSIYEILEILNACFQIDDGDDKE